MDHARRRIGPVQEILADAGPLDSPAALISQTTPKRKFKATARDAYNRTIARRQENPMRNSRRLS